jgi:hypothetical protein
MKTYYQEEISLFRRESISKLKSKEVKLYFYDVDSENLTGIISNIIFADNDSQMPFVLIFETLDKKELQISINGINKIDIL